MPQSIITLPNGQIVGTGLLVPNSLESNFPEYDEVFPMLTLDEIKKRAASGAYRGKDRFDSTYTKNQRNRGSCQGFMTAYMATKARVRRFGSNYRVDLSGAYLYSLVNGNQDNGSTLEDGMNAIKEKGCCSESLVKWNQIYRTQYDRAVADADALQYRAFECAVVRSEQALASALILGFDVGVAVHVGNNFMSLDANGIVGADSGPGNHAVHCDGINYSDAVGELEFDHMGSWGTSVHSMGRGGLTWKRHLSVTKDYHQFYVIRSTVG